MKWSAPGAPLWSTEECFNEGKQYLWWETTSFAVNQALKEDTSSYRLAPFSPRRGGLFLGPLAPHTSEEDTSQGKLHRSSSLPRFAIHCASQASEWTEVTSPSLQALYFLLHHVLGSEELFHLELLGRDTQWNLISNHHIQSVKIRWRK